MVGTLNILLQTVDGLPSAVQFTPMVSEKASPGFKARACIIKSI